MSAGDLNIHPKPGGPHEGPEPMRATIILLLFVFYYIRYIEAAVVHREGECLLASVRICTLLSPEPLWLHSLVCHPITVILMLLFFEILRIVVVV